MPAAAPGSLEQSASTSFKRRSKSLVSIGVDHRRDRRRLARRDHARGECGGDDFIAGAMSAALSIGGKTNFTVRSRHRGRMRSMHSRNAVGSPTSANSTALRVNASASPASSNRAARLTWSRQPRGRPAGLPDRPFSNGRPAHPPRRFW